MATNSIYGTTGADTLNGTLFDDYISANAGAATGNNVVHDFTDNIDTLLLDDALWSANLSVSQLLSTFGTIVGGNAVLDFGAGNSITINGVTDLSVLADDIAIL